MSARASGDVRRFDTIDSTNRYLVDEARAGAPEGTVAVAAFQTAGRGRLGRRWEAPPGACLLASVLLRPALPPDDLHLCTTLVALAGAEGCARASGVHPGLKWPNDLVVGDRKVAGVLAEAVLASGGDPAGAGPAVVVGIGLNVSWAGPPGAGGTSLEAEAGRAVDLEEVLEAVLEALAGRRRLLDGADGRAALAAEGRRRCVTLGRRVRVELAGGTVVGTATDLDDHGRLVVDRGRSAAPVTVAAGDVVHLRADAGVPAPGGAGGGPPRAGRSPGGHLPGGAGACQVG